MTEFRPRLAEKRWSISKEVELIEAWRREDLYRPRIEEGRRIFVIDTPPPYMSGRMHIGGVAHYAQIDMIARYLRMRGYVVLFPFYTDRNGLPVEVQVEKMYNIVAHEVDREKFLQLCRELLDKYEEENVKVLERWGLSFTYWRNGTDSEEYRKLTQSTFIELWRRGLIYEAERPTPWCPRCRTALSEAEIEYVEEETTLNYIKFEVDDGREIVIATTRPELLPACVAVIYNPADDRYRDLRGRRARVPLFGHEVPILEHPAAKPEFGTGLVMICTFGDVRDMMIVSELKLPVKMIIDETGKMRSEAGILAGLDVRTARARVIEELRKSGLLVKQEKIRHTVPVCWRCKTPVEIIVTRELFLRQLEYKEDLIRMVEREMVFYPEEYKRTLIEWIRSLEFDWPISRRRYYATEIPLWYCIEPDGKVKPLVPSPGRYYRPWRDEPPEEVKRDCPSGRLVGETRVLDTWFDSSISWLYACGVTKPDLNVFDKVYPHSIVRPQGYDIIRTWLYYSTLRAYLLFGKPPFRYVRISGMGLDEKGEAMHKSKGNIIDPIPPVEKYGADAVRFWAAAAAKLGSDYRYNEQLIQTGHSFVTKLWNIARFISQFPYVQDRYRLTPLDMMLLAKLEEVLRRCVRSYDSFDVYEPAYLLFDFTWHIFADHYIEAVKPRAYNREGLFSDEEQRGAWFTLHTALRVVTKLLAPIMPFVTDYIWRSLYGESVHRQVIEDRLNIEFDRSLGEILDLFMRANRAVWSYKNRHGLSLAAPLDAVLYVPERLSPIAQELRIMHKVRDVKVGRPSEPAYETLDDEAGIYIVRESSQT